MMHPEVEAALASVRYIPSPDGFGLLVADETESRHHAARDHALWQQAVRMMLSAWHNAIPSVIALLDQVVGLTIDGGPTAERIELDLRSLAHFAKLQRLQIVGYTRGDTLDALGALPALTALRLSRCTLDEGLAFLSSLPRLEVLELDDVRIEGDAVPSGHGLRSLVVRGRATSWLDRLVSRATFASLESLDVTGSALDSLAPLAGLSLRSLCVGHTPIASLDGPDLTGLVHLDAAATDLEHLDALGGGESLETLDLTGCTSLRSLVGIARAARLRRVSLAGCPGLTSLEILGRSHGLQSLQVHPATKVRSLDPIAAMTSLEELFLDDATHLTDLGPIEQFGALHRLSLRGCGATDLLPLLVLDRLESVDLRGCESVTDVAVLDALPALKTVALAGTGVDRNTLSSRLAAKVTWSASEGLPGHPAVRATVVPKGTDAATRKRVSSIRKLLGSRDLTSIAQGVELLGALGDGALYDMLLEGVDWIPIGGTWVDDAGVTQQATKTPVWVSNRVFGTTQSGAAPRNQCLAWVVGSAPTTSARATALREKITALTIEGVDDPPTVDLRCVQGLSHLRTLTLRDCATVMQAESLRTLPSLEALEVRSVRDASLFAALPPSIRSVRAQRIVAPRISFGDLPSLERLSLTESETVGELDLTGLRGLVALHVSEGTGLVRVAVSSAAPLRSLTLRFLPSLRALTFSRQTLCDVEACGVAWERVCEVLTGATGIEKLSLIEVTIPDLTVVCGLQSLRELSLMHVRGVQDLSPLLSLPALKTLTLPRSHDARTQPFVVPEGLRARVVTR